MSPVSNDGANGSTTAVSESVRAKLDLLRSPVRYHYYLNERGDSDGAKKGVDMSNVWKVDDVPCRP